MIVLVHGDDGVGTQWCTVMVVLVHSDDGAGTQ